MLYDIPGRTGVPIASDTLLAARRARRGSSPSRTPRATCSRVARSWPSTDLAYYSGDDALNLPLARPRRGRARQRRRRTSPAAAYAEMVAARRAGDLATAPPMHRRLLPAVGALMTPHRRARSRSRPALQAAGRRSSARGDCGSPLTRADATSEACGRSRAADARRLTARARSPHEPPAPRARPAARAARRRPLRIVALGGLGEIGRNMTVFEYRRQAARSSTAACCSPRTTSPAST